MLGFIAATVGGLVKDVQVGLGNAYDYVCEEVSSIPEAFSAGYDHGIMSAPSELDEAEEFHTETVEPKTKFSQKAA